ncbi:esterase/lipase family protein [Streptomyces sp. NPDC090052]|uniref:esterase/lipase family protein n=1 Tax=Streptomyces sp. NPDC090052 TaxID=3365931 RepID=UPI0038304BFF
MQRFKQDSFTKEPFGKSHSMNLHKRRARSPHTVTVFVHGLNGSGYGTWKAWPKILFDGQGEFPPTDVAMFYYPSLFKAACRLQLGANIDLQAQQLADHLQELSEEYDEIYLVAHSLGGLVAEAAVSTYLNKLGMRERDSLPVSPIAAIFLMASPLGGSGKALLLFSVFRDVRRLRLLSEEQARYAQFFNSYVQVQCLASEGNYRFIVPRFAGIATLDVAVSPTSASGSIPGEQRRQFRGTHFSVVKPKSPMDPQHTWLMASIRDVQEMRAQWHRNAKQKKLATVLQDDSASDIFITQLESERRKSAWDIIYNRVRAEASTSYVDVLDYSHVKAGTKVDLLIAVNRASGVIEGTQMSKQLVVGAVEAFESGATASVGICPVGEERIEAEAEVNNWLPSRVKNKFYIEGANDDEGIGEVIGGWIDALLHRHPSRQSNRSHQNSLRLPYDAYEEAEEL